jgi:type I restriction enzyme S subunit
VREHFLVAIPLREMVSEAKGGFASGARDSAGIVQLRMNNVTSDGSFDWSSLTRVPADRTAIDSFTLQPGDVLFNATNSAALVGKTALFVAYPEPVVFSNHFTRLRTLRNRLLPEYLAFWLQAQWRLRVFERICDRWIGQAAVQRDKLLDLSIPCPSLAEQRRIVARLTEQLAAATRARETAKTKVATVLALEAADREAVLSGEAESLWPRVPLAELLLLPLRTGLSRQGSIESTERVLTLSAVRHGRLDLTVTKPMDASEGERVRNEVRAGAFYVIRGNGRLGLVGRGGLAPADVSERVLFPDLLIQVVVDPGRVAPQFFSLVWDSREVRAEIECRCRTSAGIHKINLQNLAKVAVPLPPMEVQSRIATSFVKRLSPTSMAASAAEAELAATEALPAALLREAFGQAT